MEIFLLFYLKIDDLSIVDFLKCYFMNYAAATRKALELILVFKIEKQRYFRNL